MKLSAVHLLLASALGLAALPLSPATADSNWCPQALFAFGDDFLDVGVNQYFTPATNDTLGIAPIRASWDPYNVDFLPGSGRFTNGRNLADFIGDAMGFRKSPPPYNSLPLLAEVEQSSIQNGISFASGGAGILSTTNPGRCIPFAAQVSAFEQFAAKYTLQELNRAIFMISLAGNDFFFLGSSSPTSYLSLMVERFMNQLEALYTQGARRFIVTSSIATGCTPLARDTLRGSPVDVNGCDVLSNSLSRAFVIALREQVDAWAVAKPAARVVLVDLFNMTRDFNAFGTRYGFDSRTGLIACCGAGGSYNGSVNCGTAQGSLEYTLCPDRSRRIYFDSTHYTQRTHSLIFDNVWNGHPSYTTCPGPNGQRACPGANHYLYSCT